MCYLKPLFIAAAVGGVTFLPQAGSAGPLMTSLAAAGSTTPLIIDSPIQKVHGWHCSRKKGWYKGDRVWHHHRRACNETQDYDDDYFDEDFQHSRRPLNLYINPGIRLRFGNQGDN
jgi:hypothetical protein